MPQGCDVKSYAVLSVLGILYVLVEYFVGKTDKVKSNSVLELGVAILTLFIIFVSKKLSKEKTNG